MPIAASSGQMRGARRTAAAEKRRDQRRNRRSKNRALDVLAQPFVFALVAETETAFEGVSFDKRGGKFDERGSHRERTKIGCGARPDGQPQRRAIDGVSKRSVSKREQTGGTANRSGDLEPAPGTGICRRVLVRFDDGILPAPDGLRRTRCRIAGGQARRNAENCSSKLHVGLLRPGSTAELLARKRASQISETVSLLLGRASSAASRLPASSSQIGSSSSSMRPSSARRAFSGSIGIRANTGACASSATRCA